MDFKLLWEKIENKLYTATALIAGTLLLLTVLIVADGFISKYIPLEYIKYLYGGVFLAWIIYWVFNHFYIPKNEKNKTGVVLCIYADSEEAEKNLRRDFVDELEKQINSGSIGDVFKIITVKNHLTPKYNDLKKIKKLHKKVRGHIYIFGETKKRKNGRDQYFISLDGMVLHRPVHPKISQELSKDFLATLPKGINFNDEFAFAGFQVSADIVAKSVEYIVGIAAFISGNPFLATKVHNDLKDRIALSNNKLPSDRVILSKINNLLSSEYAIISAYYIRKNDRENAYKNIGLSLQLNPNSYHALVAESIAAFSWENNPERSLAILKKCHNVNDPTWRYNEAFLYFWLGRYNPAWKQCENIRKQNYPNELLVSQEVAQFNEILLTTITDKPALYFWLGFNYYYKQNNLPFALRYFETFMERADDSMVALTQKTSSWLIDIKKEGNWK